MQPGRGLRLGAEPLDGDVPMSGVRRQHLEGYLAPQRNLPRAVNDTHPSAPEFMQNLEIAQPAVRGQRVGGVQRTSADATRQARTQRSWPALPTKGLPQVGYQQLLNCVRLVRMQIRSPHTTVFGMTAAADHALTRTGTA